MTPEITREQAEAALAALEHRVICDKNGNDAYDILSAYITQLEQRVDDLEKAARSLLDDVDLEGHFPDLNAACGVCCVLGELKAALAQQKGEG